MNIIRATIHSLEDLVPLFNAYRVFYQQPSDEEGVAAFLRDRISHSESVILIAYEGEKAAGFVQLYPTFTSIGMQKAYILNDLFVKKEFRRRGTGKALLDEAFQFGVNESIRFIILETAPENHAAKALYESMGMQTYNEYNRYIKIFK
ncbi:GNAT family N-acetyltransferase [Mesobacillus foraminis]|uniref:GNAT family N-acetyltransferase n=1 Tax=Mesobacillus foraminis TaxID=279826 RepID=UPI00104FA9D4|nr:GNAT family N-acetyltransferase [Mesobacillus foraminis]